MASLSPTGSINGDIVGPYYNLNILSEVPHYDTYQENDVLNYVVQEMEYTELLVSNNDSYDELTSDSNVISYSDYMFTIENDVAQYVPLPEQNNGKRIENGTKTGIIGLNLVKFNYFSKLRQSREKFPSIPVERARKNESSGALGS
ncbi:hypothetical protein Tco_1545538 [Tanacetum coccineum]